MSRPENTPAPPVSQTGRSFSPFAVACLTGAAGLVMIGTALSLALLLGEDPHAVRIPATQLPAYDPEQLLMRSLPATDGSVRQQVVLAPGNEKKPLIIVDANPAALQQVEVVAQADPGQPLAKAGARRLE